MKVLHVINGWALGGIAQATLDLIQNTPDVEHYAAGYCWFGTQTEKDFNEVGCKSIHFPDEAYSNFGRIIADEGIDIIHKQTGGGDYPSWVDDANHANIPVVESIHCPRCSVIPIERIAKTVVTTQYVYDMQDRDKRHLEGHLHSIMYPCTLPFASKPRSFPTGRKLIVGRMARYEADKLPEAIVRVAEMLQEYRDQIEFHIMGYPFNEKVYNEVKAFEVPGYIKVSGLQEDKLAAVNSIDICIDPVWETSFDMVMTEAMSQAIPVVTWRNSAAPEVVGMRGSGNSGGIVSDPTIFGLARGVMKMVQGPMQYEHYSYAALDRAKEKHNPVIYGQRFQKLYEEVLNG